MSRNKGRNSKSRRVFWRRPESHVCAYCGDPATSVDHVEPVARGGGGGNDNAVAACMWCNTRKGDLPLLVFLALKRAKLLPERSRRERRANR